MTDKPKTKNTVLRIEERFKLPITAVSIRKESKGDVDLHRNLIESELMTTACCRMSDESVRNRTRNVRDPRENRTPRRCSQTR